MTLIEINIRLDPDAATAAKTQATNAQPQEKYAGGSAPRKLYELHRC